MGRFLTYIFLLVCAGSSIVFTFFPSLLWDVKRFETNFHQKTLMASQWFAEHRPTTMQAFLDTKDEGFTWFKISEWLVQAQHDHFRLSLFIINLPVLFIYLLHRWQKIKLPPFIARFVKVYLIVVGIILVLANLVVIALSGGSVLPGL